MFAMINVAIMHATVIATCIISFRVPKLSIAPNMVIILTKERARVQKNSIGSTLLIKFFRYFPIDVNLLSPFFFSILIFLPKP